VTQNGLENIAVLQILKCAWLAIGVALMLGCKATPYREVEVDLGAGGSEQPPDPRSPAGQAFRFSVAAMQSPRTTYAAYSRLFSRVSQQLGVPIDLVQRRTYREVNDLLLDGQLDAALLCTGGYLNLRRQAPAAEVLAVPVIGGKTTYQSLIIVPASSSAHSLMDLRGKRFAFTDELSLSGRAYVLHLLRQEHEAPARFFAASIFTHSHDQSIEAVASGIVDGAVVDSLVYDSALAQNQDRAATVRIIDRSPPLGMMPVVGAPSLSPAMRGRLREILLGLDRDPSAVAALRVTHIERFEVPTPGLYDTAALLMEAAR
jgi:phosphonate transport system substrate-binding protein